MTVDLDALTEQLRALRLPDEGAVIVSVGSIRMRDCGPAGAIRVTAEKGDHTATCDALRLEDALLMVRARLREAEERARKEAAEAKAKKELAA